MASEVSYSPSGSDAFASQQNSHRARSTPISSVHGNLMRSRHHQDPMRFYKVIAIMGEGSMGSVTKVKKADSARGGSARAAFVQENQSCCLRILSWLQLPGGQQQKKFVEVPINQSQGTMSSGEGTSSLSSSLRSLNNPVIRSLYGSYPPSRQMSLRDGSASMPMPTHHETSETTETEIETTVPPPKTAPPHSNQSSRSSSKSNPKKLRSQHSSLITYGTKKDTYYALKSIILDRCSSQEFRDELKNEVEILKSLDHPNIVRAIETFDYHNRLFIVLELCSGGDLYTRDPYTEAEARRIITSLFKAVAYLHINGIVHRDLKFENIMFVDESKDAEVRIIDFGLSQKFAADQHLHDAVGTVYTMAPELIGGDYDSKADIWSLGVISFMLLSSSMPFYGKDRTHVIKKILSGRYHFSSRRWKYVSSEAKHFVKTLLRRHPEKRPTANEALQLPWLNTDVDTNLNGPELEILDNIQAAIQAFSGYRTLKKLALMVVAYKSTSEEIGFLRNTFGKFDTSNDGEIQLDEFKAALSQNYSYTDEEMETMFHGIDVDGTGKVHYIEFLAATIEAHGNLDEERLAEAFDRLDSDDSGIITVKNLKEFLGEDLPDTYLEKVIDEASFSQDHTISYEEFLALWNHDADALLAHTKENVGSRRVSRAPSPTDSFDDISVGTELSSDHLSTTSSGQPTTGTYYFKKNKELSVRQGDVVNVESMSSARVNQVLEEHGILPSKQTRRREEQQQLPEMDELNQKLQAVAREQEGGTGSERKTADI